MHRQLKLAAAAPVQARRKKLLSKSPRDRNQDAVTKAHAKVRSQLVDLGVVISRALYFHSQSECPCTHFLDLDYSVSKFSNCVVATAGTNVVLPLRWPFCDCL